MILRVYLIFLCQNEAAVVKEQQQQQPKEQLKATRAPREVKPVDMSLVDAETNKTNEADKLAKKALEVSKL